MTTRILFDNVVVNGVLVDRFASSPSLDTALLFDPDLNGTITNLTQSFVSLSDLEQTFDTTTKQYKCASAHYSQDKHPARFKVGRTTTGDANLTASLNNIWNQDKDWFILLTTTKDLTLLQEIATWAQGKPIIVGFSLEPSATMLDSSSEADLANVLAALDHNNVFISAHHQAGVDASGVGISVADGVATVTETNHGLRVGDPVTVSGATPAELNGNVVVASVPTDDTWTYKTTAADGAATGTINYFARYLFPEAALQGLQLGKDIGSSSWANKMLRNQTAMPTDLINDSQLQVLRDKKYITYVNPQNNISITADGFMVTGRQIVDETVRIWIELNIATNLFNMQISNEKIPYTNPGFNLISGPIKAALNEQLKRTGLNPYSDEQDYIITLPDALSASASDRQAGIVPPIEVIARIGSSALKFTVNVTLVV